MKRIFMTAAVLAVSGGAYAAELNLNSTGFGELSPARLQLSGLEIPAPGAGVRIGKSGGCYYGMITTKLHLLARTSKSQLFVFADTEPQFREFTDMWTPILERAGLTPAGAAYKDTFGTLDYRSADGSVLRDFLMPPTVAAKAGKPFPQHWPKGGPWTAGR